MYPNSITKVPSPKHPTDCLSGMQAGHAFPGRTASSRSARYRDKELGNIHELEQRHRALLYVHVHSHT